MIGTMLVTVPGVGVSGILVTHCIVPIVVEQGMKFLNLKGVNGAKYGRQLLRSNISQWRGHFR